ncbi:MAG: hypothetical protein Q9160_000559 [Pyrenula sp. 1 TL-2023]
MDGLLIDSEDKYTICINEILHEYGRPSLPWSIKAQLQGRPGPEAGRIFHDWAQLPISNEEFMEKQAALQRKYFPDCKPLPGVEKLLKRLRATDGAESGKRVHIAVATSSHAVNFRIKTEGLKEVFGLFPESQIVKGDDPRIPKGRGKPLPDIWLLALKTINENFQSQGVESQIKPEECLVFEDSVPGAESGRRAGMRVIWCPHSGLREEYRGREKEVLAGRTGTHKEDEVQKAGASNLAAGPGTVGEIDDGWAEMLTTLEDFNFQEYEIDVVDP